MIDRAFAYGTKERIVNPVASVSLEISGDRGVQLVASFEPLPSERGRELMTAMATTLAIHMDQEAATDLYSQLRETFQTMGWPPPK
jgi:hypothetical protein